MSCKPYSRIVGLFLLLMLLILPVVDSRASIFDFFRPKESSPAQTKPEPAPAAKPAPKPKAPPQKPNFTITKIESDPKEEKIKIHFTDTVTTSGLENNLKIFPPVRIYWYNSSVSSENVATINAEFKPGQSYKVSLPEGFNSVNNKLYVKGVIAFDYPNLPSEIGFPEKGSVIERDSRELLDLMITNVDEILFRGLHVPPLMLPAAAAYSKEGMEGKTEEAGEPRAYRRHKKAKIWYAATPSKQTADSRAEGWEKFKSSLIEKAEAVKKAVGEDADFGRFIKPVREDRQVFFSKKDFNVPSNFSLPLDFRAEKEKGTIMAVLIESRKRGQPAATAPQVYSITDTGITYKLSGTSIFIWTSSFYTGKPVPGAAILAFTKDNSAYFLGAADAEGRLSAGNETFYKSISLNRPEAGIEKKKLKVGDIVFLASSTPKDSSFIELKPSEYIKPVNVTQLASPVQKEKLLNGVVFTERGIYRPGETVSFKGTVREYRDGDIRPPDNQRCRFTITDSQGQQVFQKDYGLSEFGTASDSFKVEKYMPLGEYTLKMTTEGEGAVSTETSFSVQEFQPPRHQTRIGFGRTYRDEPGYVNIKRKVEYVVCTIEGVYYAGGPVKNGKVRWTARKADTDYSRADYPDYTFGYSQGHSGEVIESGESTLDSNGKAEVAIPIGKEVLSCMEGIELNATVVDFDGRAASGSAVYKEESAMLVGVSRHPSSVQSEDPLSLRAIVIDKNGKRLESGTLAVKVLERSRTYLRQRNANGEIYWDSHEFWRERLAADVPIVNGEGTLNFDFSNGGNFIVSFTYKSPDGRRYTSGTSYDVNYGDYFDYSYSYERLSLIPERGAYRPGETARIFIGQQRPFSAALITVERSGVIDSKVVELKPGQRHLEIPIREDYYPNIYVSVIGTVPRSDFPLYKEQVDANAPSYLFGTVNLDVKKEPRGLDISINPGEVIKALPGSEITLKLSCKDPEGKPVVGELAVCVVDESVLALTGFKTPRLDQIIRFTTPLSVFTGELRNELLKQTLYDFVKVNPLTGGDGGGLQKLANKLRKDFSPVAYFNPKVVTGEDGRAAVTFKFPDTMTEYRIYAVACDKGSRFGSAERSGVVVKDFYMEPGLPRFFTKGDTFSFNVSGFNKTAATGEMGFKVESNDRLKLQALKDSYSLGQFDNVLAGVKGAAVKAGSADVTFAGSFGKLADSVLIKLPVYSGLILENDSAFGTFRKDVLIQYVFPKGTRDIPENDINPEEARAVLTISGSPFLRMAGGLKYLLHYPYGCIEQTSSGVLALAGLRGIISQGLVPGITVDDTDKYLKPGLERLMSMQVDSGGFSYWPGEHTVNMWGSVYATYALTLAKSAGLGVPQDRLDRALAYLSSAMTAEGSKDVHFKAYAAYMLALNGRLSQGAVKNLNDELQKEPNREAAVLTLLAVKANGFMKDQELKMLARMIFEKGQTPQSGRYRYGFYAPFRDEAVELIAASEILPGEKPADDAAKRLLAGMERGIWTSTSDTGWALIALGSYFKNARFGSEPMHGTVKQSGRTVAEFNIPPAGSFTADVDMKAFMQEPRIEVSTDNSSTLLYRLELKYPRPDYADKGYSNGFDIYKEIKNLNGSKNIKVGDVVEVKVRISTKNTDNRYVVIDDPLPAGLVAINSAIKTEEHYGKKPDDDEAYWWSYWDEDGFYSLQPNHLEMRDDRVVVFRNYLWSGTYQYSYYARAVCEGDFVMPSSKVQLMYEPSVAAYTPVGRLVIEGNK